MNQPALRVSYSTVQTVRDCEQKYVYKYIDRLAPVVEDATPLYLGTVIHTYLEKYYRQLKGAKQPDVDAAHVKALLQTVEQHDFEMAKLSKTAASIGADDLAKDLLQIVPRALTLAKVYHRVHRDDIRRHEVVMVEEKFVYPVKEYPGELEVVLPGRIDLVTRDRQTGQHILWEHKTTKRVPRQDSRLSDLQTFLYNVVLEGLYGIRADVIMWDYIQTIPPKQPALLKKAPWISQAANQITTVELYVEALRDNKKLLAEHGLGPVDFKDAVELVRERERGTMMIRYELPVLGREDVLLQDYLTTVEHIEVLNQDPSRAVRNIGFLCTFCPFAELCKTVLTGGDETSDRNAHFVTQPEHPNAVAERQEINLEDADGIV